MTKPELPEDLKRLSENAQKDLAKILRNLKGRRFNMLKGRPNWNCKCDCGRRVAVNHGRLIYDAVYSCGCTRRPRGKKRFHTVKHIEK